MLLCGAPCLSVGYLSVVYEFVDHGVILRAEEHLSRFGRTCRTEMIYPTVANMRHGSTVCVEFEHRHSGAHLHHFIGVILLSKGKQRLIHCLIDHLIRENALYRRSLEQICAHSLRDSLARYLATVVSSHAVAYDE